MMYHIQIERKNGTSECKSDLTKEELVNRYVEPYLFGETFVMNGTTVTPDLLNRIKITRSDNSLKDRIQELIKDDEYDPSPYRIFNNSPEWRAIDECTDMTDDFIVSAPASKKRKHESKSAQLSINTNKVFVVHGHDIELKNDVELFLKEINLEPIVLHRQLDEGLTVIEKFEKHSDVNFAIVLLTPDDIGYSKSEADKVEENRKIEFRSRQNVIFEFGYFVGKLGRKGVCCIYKSGVSLPSDLSGLIYKQVHKTVEEVGMSLMKELKNAGLEVKFE